VKEAQAASHDAATGTRGARGRGGLEGRARGRGTDRGRGARGGRASSHANGTKTSEKPAKTAQDGWGDTTAAMTTEATGSWAEAPTNGDTVASDQVAGNETSKEPTAKSEEAKSNVIPSGKVTGWAGLFAKPAPEPAPKKSAIPAPPPAEESLLQPEEKEPDEVAEQPPAESSVDGIIPDVEGTPSSESAITLAPSKDELTHDNLEHIPDVSQPIATATAASTVASTQDPNSILTSTQQALRPGMSGYAASALKATSGSGRSSSFQRRVLEQQEAVVMPENHAVSRAAMQFGSMNINGSPDDPMLEEDREEPETRTQLPDDSPIAPRASLPPPPTGQAPAPAEAAPAARPAPGLPPVPQQQSTSPPPTTAYADQFARYGQPAQKAYDTFGQQPAQQQQSQAQDAFASQAPTQTQQASTSAPTDYSAFYNQDAQRNISYQNYYGYGQTQDVQQRSGSAFGSTATETQPQYATSRPQAGFPQQDTQHSGTNTPNPAVSSQQPQQQSQQMHQGQGSHGGYPYGYANAGYNQSYPQYASYMNQMSQHQYGQNRPMFDDARRYDDSYMSHSNQYGSYGRQYGGHYNKSGMYNQPQHQPQHQYSYEHSSSPANAGTFNQSSMGREGGYGITGSAQPSESQQAAGSSAFGGMNDPFSRDQSGFGGHTPMSQQHAGQMGLDEPSKGYDPAKTSGPSPSIKTAHRPASAANTMQSQQASQSGGFPPPQNQQGNQQGSQQAFGGYPQYGGFSSNVAGHQQGQSNHPQSTQQYGAYGGSAGFGNYGGYGSGRGWSGSYGGGH
jgi:hypothetical protein